MVKVARSRFCAFVLLTGLFVACGSSGGGGGGDNGPPSIVLGTFQPAGQVIGQIDFSGQDGNQGGSAAADTLDAPSLMGDGSFYIADFSNNRVLGYEFPIVGNGANADYVIGQPDFTTTTSGTTASTLQGPSGVLVAGGRLFVTDSANNRVLIWNSVPTSNVAADVVVGQANFTSSGAATTQTGLDGPFAVIVGGNRMIVSDFQNDRILIWNSIPTTNGAAADVVLGKPDFTTSGDSAGASGLAGPLGLWTDGQRLICADGRNDRVLIWNAIPTTNAAPANVVIGHPDFVTTTGAAGPQKMDGPIGVASNGTQLFVADFNNNRVLIYDQIPTANNEAADHVLGQSDFSNTAVNDDDQDTVPDLMPSARTLNGPYAIHVIGNQLYVCDISNHRVLVFP